MLSPIRLLLKEQSDLGVHCLPFHGYSFTCHQEVKWIRKIFGSDFNANLAMIMANRNGAGQSNFWTG